MTKDELLTEVAKEIFQCKICKTGTSGCAVPGEGNSSAEIVFIGEAPGKNEAKTGRPFIGRSGQLLRKLIRDTQLFEKDVFITSPVKYLPDKGTPTPTQIQHGMIHLRKQLLIIKPRIVVLLGSTAIRGVLGEKLPVLKVHGSIVTKEDIKYLVTIHPAAALRFPHLKAILESDFLKLQHLPKW